MRPMIQAGIAEVAAFVDRIGRGGAPLIPFDQLVNVTRATFAAVQSASERRPVNPDRPNPTDS